MSIKPEIKKAVLTGLIAFSAFSFVYVNSQYDICPMGWGEDIAFINESVQEDVDDSDSDFLTLPDLSMLEKGVNLLKRLKRL